MFDGGRAVTCVGGSSCVPEDLVIFSVLVRVPKDLIRTCTVQYVCSCKLYESTFESTK